MYGPQTDFLPGFLKRVSPLKNPDQVGSLGWRIGWARNVVVVLVSSAEKVVLKPAKRMDDGVGARLSSAGEVPERSVNYASKDPKQWHDPSHPFLRLLAPKTRTGSNIDDSCKIKGLCG